MFALDIPEILFEVANYLDLHELFCLAQVDSVRHSYIQTFPFSHLTINIRTFQQFYYLITHYNFKHYCLTDVFFRVNSGNNEKLVQELQYFNTFSKKILTTKLAIQLRSNPIMYVYPIELFCFFLKNNYRPHKIDHNLVVSHLIFENGKIIGYFLHSGDSVSVNILHILLDNIFVSDIEELKMDSHKYCLGYCGDITSTASSFGQIKELILGWNEEKKTDQLYALIDSLHDCDMLYYSHLLPKIDISSSELQHVYNYFQHKPKKINFSTFVLFIIFISHISDDDMICSNFYWPALPLSISIQYILENVTNQFLRNSFIEECITMDPAEFIQNIKYSDMSCVVSKLYQDYFTNWIFGDKSQLDLWCLIDTACKFDNLDVIKYIYAYHRHDLCLARYTHMAFKNMIRNNSHNILKWWCEQKEWPLKIRKTRGTYWKIFAGQIETFEIVLRYKLVPLFYILRNVAAPWWNYVGNRIQITPQHVIINTVTPYILSAVASSGNINVLSCWFKYIMTKVKEYTGHNHIAEGEVLEKIFPSEYHFFIEMAVEYNNLDMIKWWINKGLPFWYTPKAFNLACNLGHMEIVNFFLKNATKKVRSTKAIEWNQQVNGKWRTPFILLYTMKGLTTLAKQIRFESYDNDDGEKSAILDQMIDTWQKYNLMYGKLTIHDIKQMCANKMAGVD